ncbi:MAG: sugar phosphate isomerase/epimerase [Thermogutta sp.]|nr:sugar phosphate isomerase/epimerase [Thermogutta sp.]
MKSLGPEDSTRSVSGGISRRGFWARSAAWGAAAYAAWAGGSAAAERREIAAAADAAPEVWPVTCRDVMLCRTGKADCWAAMEAFGVDGVESDVTEELNLPNLFEGDISHGLADGDRQAKLREALQKVGRRITALCMHNRFDERPEDELEWCRKTAAAAQAMGIPVIRIDVVPRRLSREEFPPFAADMMKKVTLATAETGVRWAIENHGSTTNDPEFLNSLFAAVGSPNLGLTLDTGNFYWFGHPLSELYGIYETFAPRTFHTHCKSIAYPPEDRDRRRPMGYRYAEFHCPIDRGDIDFGRVLAILRKAGYSHDLCIENEALGGLTPEQAVETVSREVRLLKNLQATITRSGRFSPVARA